MRIRTIKPEFWTDEKIVQLAPFSRLLFVGLWCMVDDEGRMEFSLPRIKMTLFPADNIDVAEFCADLRKFALIEVYSVEGREYLQVIGFRKHQRVDERRKSLLPPAPCVILPGKKPRKGREGKGKEGNGYAADAAQSVPAPESDPELFRWLRGCDMYASDSRFLSGVVPALKSIALSYPDFDFVTELHKSHAWLIANQDKPRKNKLKFFINWINRTIERMEPSHGSANNDGRGGSSGGDRQGENQGEKDNRPDVAAS